ncbi:DUF4007 family protein [Geobacillus sp. JS12]|jgi:hypothetical protein|uniref:DUF4007 family protein n=1 Tax=Geobacillus sp. JS12 TaxID=1813182 RepID=UPI00078CC221|nr:DUF4007 family protein [Geobacillus sp. JS12]AMQ20895.1 hypothetical protein A0V43_08305 [Geobacillus sp. JS12]
MAYGQHQSFYLRDRWLSKGLRHLMGDKRFFYNKDSFEKVGLGKNMLQSLRFWVIATRLVEEKVDKDQKRVHYITPLGEVIYKFDRFVRFNETAAILHYEMTKEKEPATAWYWFFNIFPQQVVSKDELLQFFVYWVNEQETREVSIKSLKRDIECLLKLYTAGQSTFDPEEVIHSPIQKIGLIEEHNNIIYKKIPDIKDIGITALMYSLLDYKAKKGIDTVSVDEIVNEKGLWGKVFNMDRSSVVNALELLVNRPLYHISFTRTNNLDTVKLPDVSPIEYLQFEYARKVESLV